MKDLLEHLADLEVREPPPEFDRELHERLNRSLTIQHLLGLVAEAVPWALLHFLRAVLGAVNFTLTGKFEGKPEQRSGEGDQG